MRARGVGEDGTSFGVSSSVEGAAAVLRKGRINQVVSF